MNNDNSIDLIDFFSKVLVSYKLYIPIIILSTVLGYALADKTTKYKTTVLMTDIYGVMDNIDNKRGVIVATIISDDEKNSKDYLESLIMSYKSTYTKYEKKRYKLLSEYYTKYNGSNNDNIFQFKNYDQIKTFFFWKEYTNEELFDLEWLPVETIKPRLISNIIVSALIGIIIALFITIILIVIRTEITNNSEK
jgi:hypothetical protein